jgi:hypothetical protein
VSTGDDAIRDSGKVKARERIAVLAALNLAYQLAESAAARTPRRRHAPERSALPAELADIDLDGCCSASMPPWATTASCCDFQRTPQGHRTEV